MDEAQVLLDQLHDIQAPTASTWPAPGWWLLLLLVIVAALLAIKVRKILRARLWHKHARAELASIQADLGSDAAATTLARCSVLARRLLLMTDKREHVADLHGDAWLATLDRVCGKPVFTQGFGRLLRDQPYQLNPHVEQQDLVELMDAMDTLQRACFRKGVAGGERQ